VRRTAAYSPLEDELDQYHLMINRSFRSNRNAADRVADPPPRSARGWELAIIHN
jgi:hypothetical protein